jgi:ankyrin repeat protein
MNSIFMGVQVEATQALLELSANVDAVNRINGSTPLHCAVQSARGTKLNRLECVRLIIEVGGADINIQDSYGKTPIDYLNIMEQEEERDSEDSTTVQHYYKAMRNLLTPPENSNLSLLIHAIETLDMIQVQMILSENQPLQQKDGKQLLDQCQLESGMNPLHFAVDKLIQNSNSDLGDISAVHTDAQKLFDIIRLLLESGADPNSMRIDKMDKTVLSAAMNTQVKETFDSSLAPLHILCQALQKLYMSNNTNNSSFISILEQCILSLKQYGAIIGQDTVYLMHDSSRRNNVGFVSFLIEKLGLDPNTRGRQGFTPLHFAARSGHVEVVRYLLNKIPSTCSYKVDMNIVDDLGMTALDAARINGKDTVVQLLTGEQPSA